MCFEERGRKRNGWLLALAGSLLIWICPGCDRGPVEFSSNDVYSLVLAKETGLSSEPSEAMGLATADVLELVEDLFGTPDQPEWPDRLVADQRLSGLLDWSQVSRAAGPVYSDKQGLQFGLYREHCNACHGVNGDGRGPVAALQNPYPRDYRAGIFKFQSTSRGMAPRRQDLLRTIRHGLPGTAMPSFQLLDEADCLALVDYVIYLSIRGEVERRLLAFTAREMDYGNNVGSGSHGDRWLRPMERAQEEELAAEQLEMIDAQMIPVLERWAASLTDELPGEPLVVDSIPASTPELIAAGKQLFHGALANCYSCHGDGGDGVTALPLDFDDWTKEWTTRMGLDPRDKEALADFFAVGALRPKGLPARALTRGVFRGGDSPSELYLRLLNGIPGTPMPAINLVEEAGPSGLTRLQVWSLVHYVRSLSQQETQVTATLQASPAMQGEEG